MTSDWVRLPAPRSWSAAEHSLFAEVAGRLANASEDSASLVYSNSATANQSMTAAMTILADLHTQGWQVKADRSGAVSVLPPAGQASVIVEKNRIRQQELVKRAEQLRRPSVRQFIRRMERPHEHNGSFVSILSLMRDGEDLATSLVAHRNHPGLVIDPYVQVVDREVRCEHTGFRLMDVWRYFRHTWANQYTSTPGRTMQFLVRDRGAPFHPVIGIAALGSAVVQIRERDEWIGWQPATFLSRLEKLPSLRWARWVADRLERGFAEIYVEDLLEDGLYWPGLWDSPSLDAAEKLRGEASSRRQDHQRFGRRSDFKAPIDDHDADAWQTRARTDLFRSKRCIALADLLVAKHALEPFLSPSPSRTGLENALRDSKARRAITQLLRRAKAEAVGTEIADLTVCGALPPYNELIGGKLVGLLAVSPTVAAAYHGRYRSYASQIASSMAGRPIYRRSNLVFVGTTSLYGATSSQYNRLKLPPDVISNQSPIEFKRIGESRSFGTSHLSQRSIDALTALSEQSRTGVRVKSIFGEGVNPKLRKVRDGFDRLGWPSDELLQHRRLRTVYGVRLVDNLIDYLLGIDESPRFLFRRDIADDQSLISAWWIDRWLRMRIRPEILERVRNHRAEGAGHHGARVLLPDVDESTPGD